MSQQRAQESSFLQEKDRRQTRIFQAANDTSPYSTQIRKVEEDLVEHAEDYEPSLEME